VIESTGYTLQDTYSSASEVSTNLSSGSALKKYESYVNRNCRVRFPHAPRMDDELMLTENDQVVVEQVFMDGWAYGWNRRLQKRGMFPMNCLESPGY
jgi:hypothetical protein